MYQTLIAPFDNFSFMRMALVGVLALALINGPIGLMLLMRRMTLVGNVLSHAVVPGAALGFVMVGPSMAVMGLTGFLSGVVVAILAGVATQLTPLRQDVNFVAFYLLSLTAGSLLVLAFGSNVDLMRVFFGTVLAIDLGVLAMIAAIATVVLVGLAVFYRPLLVDGFDPRFLGSVAGRTDVYAGMFMAMVVATLVANFLALGTLLAVGPLLLPAAAARCWATRLGAAMALSVLLGALGGYGGLLMSLHANMPSGPSIVLADGIIFVIALAASGRWSVMSRFKARGISP
ncbi:metal ABC transporter permease [Vineibacter terrae]|uniref:Metal ABC transporter permease n=1 Tax=Vineibacter terrae TaxID=2586908 RepID=A0A5C8PWB2_9HYPH|nr:metal ABC transporter permease [Vineibacter terrae]TXL82149.1 metal ABC transporter permease [Vineibacter terrae]